MPQADPLPRPSRTEWALLAFGLGVLITGAAITPEHSWGKIVAVAAMVIMFVPAYRVRTRRVAAMRSRPPT